MLTSATGNNRRAACYFHPRESGDPWARATAGALSQREQGFTLCWRSAEHGFTLIELLIVLVLLGLASAAVMVAMPDSRGSVTAEAERFAARAKAAQDRAVIESRAMAIRVTGAGYGFDRRTRGQWEAIDAKPFSDQRWGEGIGASVGGSDAARIVFDSTGMADPSVVTLIREGEQATITIAQDGSIDVSA
jgi:general secretion pathway protein H